MLGTQFADFAAAMGQERVRALRINPAKTTPHQVAELLGVRLEPVPWCPTGFVLPPGVRVGGHPAHLAGLFYLQEPSSMFAAQAVALDPAAVGPGAVVADVAAAPGGKTTHLAGLVGTQGLVVAAEVIGSRMRPLHDSLDLWGAPSVITTNTEIADLAHTGAVCDAVVLDAPCSGEGLFRRDRASVQHWSMDAVRGSAHRQRGLIRDAAELVAPGGTLVYSTCTFAPEENEHVVADFVANNADWTVADAAFCPGVSPGEPISHTGTERTARLWPHHGPAEGQYVARLRRLDPTRMDPVNNHSRSESNTTATTHQQWGAPKNKLNTTGHNSDPANKPDPWAEAAWPQHPTTQRAGTPRSGRAGGTKHNHKRRRHPGRNNHLIHRTAVSEHEVLAAWQDFHRTYIPGMDAPEERVIIRDDRAYLAAHTVTNSGFSDHLHSFARPGMPLGRLRPGRFEPHPGLATGVPPVHAAHVVRFNQGSAQLAAYLRGETVSSPGPDGWVLISYEQWGLGWSKRSQGVLKNFLPTHLRTK